MTCKINIGNTWFGIYIRPNGGRTTIFKNGKVYWRGQWFPSEQYLRLDQFPFETVRQRLENYISKQKFNIVFPYIEGYHAFT